MGTDTIQVRRVGDYESTDYEYHLGMFLPAPRGFREIDQVRERWRMLQTDPDVAPLRVWADGLAARRGATVPQFDPAEGGTAVRALMVLESPGPMTDVKGARRGSGFISVDNDDATAAAVWRARADTGLLSGVLHWNIVPWHLGAVRRPTPSEIADGARCLKDVLAMLPSLQTVVLCGHPARDGWSEHISKSEASRYEVVRTWHPSAQSLNQPGKREEFGKALGEVATHLSR